MNSAQRGVSDVGPLSEPVRVSHCRDGDSPSRAVVEALADITGVAPDALADEADIVLYDHVDPDALDALVAHRPDSEIALSFSVADYEVRVDDDEVVVRHAE